MPYGAPSVGIPQPNAGLAGPVPNQPVPQDLPQAPAMPAAAAPSEAPEPSEPKFNEDELGKILSARESNAKSMSPMDNPDSFVQGADAQGSPWQLAQASIGRNINERLQIWSKMVGDQNAVIGPDNDIWLKGKDNVFHPADHGHTNMLQTIAKKTGAGIDLTAQAFTELAAAGGGFLMGGPPGGAAGAVAGLAAGPAVGSYGRQFLENRFYGVQPDKEQLKRDILIGGGINMLLGGVFSGVGVGKGIANKVSEQAAETAGNRAIKIARAQEGAKQFMDIVGATPAQFGEEGIAAPLSQAGQRTYSAVDYKRKLLNDQIGAAKDQIIAASPAKPDLSLLANQTKDFLQKNGMAFDERGFPKPFKDIPVNASEVGSPNVSEASIHSPLGAEGGTGVLNDMAEDYKAMISGQMDMKDFMSKIQSWQDKSDFKVFDTRSTKIRSAWAQLQHAGTVVRDGEIQKRFQNDPDMLKAIQNAYSDYSSSKDAIDLVMNQFGDKGAYEAGAKNLFDSKNESVLSGLKTLMADKPQVFKDLRGSWLSEKMSSYVNDDGLFDAPAFFKSLKIESKAQMSTLFEPSELGKLQRAAKIMGNIKTSDLIAPEQGRAVSESIADLVAMGNKFDISKPSSLFTFLKTKPKLADYVANQGLPALANKATAEEASLLNNTARSIRNWVVSDRMVKSKSMMESAANLPFMPNLRGTLQQMARNTKIGPGLAGALGGNNVVPVVPPQQPEGETGSEAAVSNLLGQ